MPEGDRAQSAAAAIGSVRASGLEPGPAVIAVLDAWGRGVITDDEFLQFERRIAGGEYA